jgi:hypothetical protein
MTVEGRTRECLGEKVGGHVKRRTSYETHHAVKDVIT